VRRPSRPSPRPASPELRQRALAALALAVLSLIGIMLLGSDIRRGIVVLAVTLVIGAVALFLSITTTSRSRRAGSARPRLVILATVLAVIGTGMSALALVVFAVYWTQLSQYASCIAAANTVTTTNACDQQLNNSLQAGVGLFGR
jgi:hypothetical protein